MQNIDAIRNALPDAAKDLKLNLQAVLRDSKLSPMQTWGTALTAAWFLKDTELAAAIEADGREAGALDDASVDDARAAAAIMSMNTIYYRFRHMVRGDDYAKMAPQLRMNRMSQVATDKGTFELFSMACAVLEGCQMCIGAHEQSIRKHDMTEQHVHESVRIAAVINGVSTARQLARV